MSNGIWSPTDFRNARDLAIGEMGKNNDLFVIKVSSERNDVFSGGAVDKVTMESFSGGKSLASRTGLIRREYLESLLSAGGIYSTFGNLKEFLEQPEVELRIEMSKVVVDCVIKAEELAAKLEDASDSEYDKIDRQLDKLADEAEKLMEDPKNYRVYLHDTQTGEMYDLRTDEGISDLPSLLSKRPEPAEKAKKPKKPLRA